MLKYLIQTSIFRCSKNYGSLTHETRIKDAVNMEDLICLLATVRTLKLVYVTVADADIGSPKSLNTLPIYSLINICNTCRWNFNKTVWFKLYEMLSFLTKKNKKQKKTKTKNKTKTRTKTKQNKTKQKTKTKTKQKTNKQTKKQVFLIPF